MATITDQLSNDARCYDRCIPDGMHQSVVISLLAKLLLAFNPAADVTTTTLLREARCYTRCIPPGEEGGVMIYLLNQIYLNLGGGGHSTVVWQFNGAPDTPGGDIVIIAFDREPGCNSIWWWDPVLDVWTQFDVEGMTGNFAVPTIVELRQIVTVDCPPVSAVTFGNLVVGDGQGAHYYFDATDAQADNGMSVIIPNDITRPDPGSWLQFSPA